MIETNYFILPHDLYETVKQDAEEFNVPLDYFLLEFCNVTGDYVIYD